MFFAFTSFKISCLKTLFPSCDFLQIKYFSYFKIIKSHGDFLFFFPYFFFLHKIKFLSYIFYNILYSKSEMLYKISQITVSLAEWLNELRGWLFWMVGWRVVSDKMQLFLLLTPTRI